MLSSDLLSRVNSVHQIKNALRGKDNDECSLLLRAARSGRTNLFKTVLDTLKFNLPEGQVRHQPSCLVCLSFVWAAKHPGTVVWGRGKYMGWSSQG